MERAERLSYYTVNFTAFWKRISLGEYHVHNILFPLTDDDDDDNASNSTLSCSSMAYTSGGGGGWPTTPQWPQQTTINPTDTDIGKTPYAIIQRVTKLWILWVIYELAKTSLCADISNKLREDVSREGRKLHIGGARNVYIPTAEWTTFGRIWLRGRAAVGWCLSRRTMAIGAWLWGHTFEKRADEMAAGLHRLCAMALRPVPVRPVNRQHYNDLKMVEMTQEGRVARRG